MIYRIKPLRWEKNPRTGVYRAYGLDDEYAATDEFWVYNGRRNQVVSLAEAMRGAYNHHVERITQYLEEVK